MKVLVLVLFTFGISNPSINLSYAVFYGLRVKGINFTGIGSDYTQSNLKPDVSKGMYRHHDRLKYNKCDYNWGCVTKFSPSDVSKHVLVSLRASK